MSCKVCLFMFLGASSNKCCYDRIIKGLPAFNSFPSHCSCLVRHVTGQGGHSASVLLQPHIAREAASYCKGGGLIIKGRGASYCYLIMQGIEAASYCKGPHNARDRGGLILLPHNARDRGGLILLPHIRGRGASYCYLTLRKRDASY